MKYSTPFFSAWSLFLALGSVESVPPQLYGCFPPWGPVITMRGLTQPFLPLPDPSSWKSSMLAGPAPMGPGGRESEAPSSWGLLQGQLGRMEGTAGRTRLEPALHGPIYPGTWVPGRQMRLWEPGIQGQVWEQRVTREGR